MCICTIICYRNLRPGDHIEAVGDGYTYYHHGIFLGHDQGRNNVAEVVNEETAPRYTNLNSFTVNGTKPLYRINYRQCDPAAQVVSRAKHFVAHPEKWGPYNLLSHNCEHFATYCKTGKAMSLQLLKKIKSFAFGGFLAALWPNK